MRHGKKNNSLSRKSAHRKALLTNLAKSLIHNKRIFTNLAKAKALRSFIEPLITKTKNDSTHARRVVFSYFQDKEPVKELFNEIAHKVSNRPGGYTRIIKLVGNRVGDGAEQCMIELVDYNDIFRTKSNSKEEQKPKTRRGGRKKKVEASLDQVAAPSNDSEKQPVNTEGSMSENAETSNVVSSKEATSATKKTNKIEKKKN